MRPFRFRLAAALDLRRQQDADAQRARGVAALTLQAAEAAVRASEHSLGEAMARSAEEQSRGSDAAVLAWHRNWIVRWRTVITEQRSVVAARQADLRAADARALETRRRFKSLDRLRERAWDLYESERRRIEQQEMDAFGVLRHAFRARTVPGGDNAGAETPVREETGGN
jgi:flagellar export protein FliJ